MRNFMVILRGMLRTPVFSGIAILSLALGIGANTAMFSLLNQFLLRLLPVKNPRELVFLYQPGPRQGRVSEDEGGGESFSYPMFREMQTGMPAMFSGLGGARGMAASIAFRNSAVLGTAHLVSGNYFDLLGVTPAMGRLLTEDDDRTENGHPVVVLSYSYWSSRFGADPSMLNQTMMVNGYPMTVIGVTKKEFLSEWLGEPPDIFAPISMKKTLTPDWDGFQDRKFYWVSLFARMKPGVTLAQADAAINVLYAGQREKDVQVLNRPSPTFLSRFQAKKIILRPGEHGRGGLRQQGRDPMLLLMGMTAMVLLISCANVANLQLARASARSREIAVRLALGASRLQLIRQLLTESCLLAGAGGALGLVAAYWTLRGIIASLPSGGMQTVLTPSLDLMVLVFCFALSLFSGLAFGLFPALQSTRPDVVPALKSQSGQSGSSGSANAFRKALATAQVAISLLLLIGAGLFARTLVNLSKIDLGLKVDHLLTFELSPRLSQYTDQATAQFYDQLRARLAAIPGVRLVSAASIAAIAGDTSTGNVTVEGFQSTADGDADSNRNSVGPDYFRTMGMALIAGREFTEADNLGAPKVGVVNEAFVRHFFADQNPLGRHFALGGGTRVKPDIEIVGVVKNAKYATLREAPPIADYVPYRQVLRQGELHFYLRTAIEPEQIAAQIRREVAALDPNLPIRDLKSMQAQVDENLFAERALSLLTRCFASLATLLAALGLYGVLAYNVSRRTREIGIRMALGAKAGDVRGLVLREVAVMLAVGMALGFLAAAGIGRLIRAQLFGLQYWDFSVYLSAGVILAAIALAAAYLPTRRATAVDPMVALRYE